MPGIRPPSPFGDAPVARWYSADARWRVDAHLSLGAIAADFQVGPALKQALGKDEPFYVLYAEYRF